MSLLKRMRDITVATLNEMLDNAEDPVRLIDRYLADRREQLAEAERLYRQCLNHAATLRQQYLDAHAQKEKREQQAMVALKAGEEQVARIALQEKLQQEEKSEQYRKLYEQSQNAVLDLEEQLKQLRADYQEVYDKRGYYQARMESLRLQQRMNERLVNGFPGATTGIPRMFDRLDERLSDLEYETKSLRDLRRMGRETLQEAGLLANQLLENELAALRRKLEQEGWAKER